MGSGTNLVTTVIGFGLSATFIVFVCTRIICGRLRGHVGSRTIYEFESRADIERAEYHANGPEPAFVAAIPTLNFNQEAFSSIQSTQNASEAKHVRPVTFTISQSLNETNTSERNTVNARQVEPNASSNSLQLTSGEPEARQ